jgi:hypothetical protein
MLLISNLAHRTHRQIKLSAHHRIKKLAHQIISTSAHQKNSTSNYHCSDTVFPLGYSTE